MIDIDEYARRAVASPIAEPPEMATVTGLAMRQRRRRIIVRTASALALAGVVGLASVAFVSARDRASQIDVRSPGQIVGRFYPTIDATDRATLVLPSGRTVTLSGGVTKAIGGLGAAFWGHVLPKVSGVCCSVRFNVYRGAPGDLFDTPGPQEISTPVLVTPAQAKDGALQRGAGRFAILSTGDWTLVAIFSDDNDATTADAALLQRLEGWRVRSTPDGAVLEVPADRTIDYSAVAFGVAGTGRMVELNEDCYRGAARTITAMEGGRAAGRWCEQGLEVSIEGPRSYVDSVVAHLEINVGPRPPAATSSSTTPTSTTNASLPRNLATDASVRAALVVAFADGQRIDVNYVAGTVAGSVYYAYDPDTHTFWALADFSASDAAQRAHQRLSGTPSDPFIYFQDGPMVLSRTDTSAWRLVGDTGGLVCPPRPPAAVLALWAIGGGADCK